MGSESAFASLCGVCPIETSSGKTVRHRLNRGGNRRANRALHVIVLNRMKYDDRTKKCVERRTRDGKSKREIMRCLKRYVAREVYRALLHPAETRHPSGDALRAKRVSAGLTQKEVAAMLGVESIRISEIDRDARKHFGIRDRYVDLLRDLSEASETTLDTQ